jgi:hypothetical protein
MSADDLAPPSSAATTPPAPNATTPTDTGADSAKPARSDNDLSASKAANKRMGVILTGAEKHHAVVDGQSYPVITFFAGPLDADMIRGPRADFAKQSKAAQQGGEDEKESEKAYNDTLKVSEARLENAETFLDRYDKHGAGTGRSTFFPALGQSQSVPARQRAFANGLRMDAQGNRWLVKLPGMDPRAFDVAADALEQKEEKAAAQVTAVQTARTLRDLAGKDLRALVKEAEALLDYGLPPFRTKAGDPARLMPKKVAAGEDG